MKKRIACILVMAVMIIASSLPLTASACTYWLDAPTKYNNSYTAVTPSNPGKKDAYVTVKICGTTGSTLDVKMTDEKGNVVWSENNAIRITKNSAGFGTVQTRRFKLGKDHKGYRLYFRQRSGCSNISISKTEKCSVK